MLHVRDRKPLVVHVGGHVTSQSRAHLQIECIQGHESKRESAHQSSKQHQSCSHEKEEPEFFGSWFDVVSITHEFHPQPHPSALRCVDSANQRRIRPPTSLPFLRVRRTAAAWTRVRRGRARFRDARRQAAVENIRLDSHGIPGHGRRLDEGWFHPCTNAMG